MEMEVPSKESTHCRLCVEQLLATPATFLID